MSDAASIPDRMTALLSRACDRTATADDIAEVNRLLRSGGEAVRVYLEYMDLHANLSADAPMTGSLDAPMHAVEPSVASPSVVGRIGRWSGRPFAAAAALAIAGAVGAIIAWVLIASGGTDDAGAPAERPVVAVLVRAAGVEWEQTPGDAILAEGSSIDAGRLVLRSGTAEFELRSGVSVTLEGPAALTLETSMRSYLHRGRLVATVPPGAVGFTVDTPTMSVVDMGTEFGVTVEEGGDTRVSVYMGSIEVGALSESRGRIGPTVAMSVGQSASVATGDRRVMLGHVADAGDVGTASPFAGPIELGNLFDDGKGATLAAAMVSDGFAAAADASDLGVARLVQGGSGEVELTAGVRFDLSPLGWSDGKWGSIANDAWTGDEGRSKDPIAGIRTKGESIGEGFSREEAGIGMHANAMIVFDLDELRRAGRLGGRAMRLVVDRAGINDESFGGGSVRVAVLVADERAVIGGYVNGRRYEAQLGDDDAWRLNGDRYDMLTGDGRFAAFDVPVPAGARYLALIATAAEDLSGGTGKDHAVFSGARLEVEP